MDKKLTKHIYGRCRICGENIYELLDVHRIKFGESGGKYIFSNIVTLCVKHHRLVHSGLIKILGWVDSTAGQLLHYIDENGNEQFK